MAEGSHAGRLGSWIVVVLMWIGFVVGGIALVTGPTWWLFWTGAGIVAIGGILGLVVRIFDDVIIDAPRIIPEEAHPAVLRARGKEGQAGPGHATDPASTKWHG